MHYLCIPLYLGCCSLNLVFLTGNELRDFIIEALKGIQHSTCGKIGHTSLGKGETRYFPCPPGTVGSVIKITSDLRNIVLCEVEVYGTQGKIPVLNIM